MSPPHEAEMASHWVNAYPNVLKEFLCRKCKTPARVKEGKPDEWACATCGFSTRFLFVHFVRIDEP